MHTQQRSTYKRSVHFFRMTLVQVRLVYGVYTEAVSTELICAAMTT